MKIEGYVGICRICFEPIKEGEEMICSDKGYYFHCHCVEINTNSNCPVVNKKVGLNDAII